MSEQPDGIHTIPVPRGMTVQEAWHNIRGGALLMDTDPHWVNVEIRGGDLHLVLGEVSHPRSDLLATLDDLAQRVDACKRDSRMRDPAFERVWIGLCDAADGLRSARDGWPA